LFSAVRELENCIERAIALANQRRNHPSTICRRRRTDQLPTMQAVETATSTAPSRVQAANKMLAAKSSVSTGARFTDQSSATVPQNV
jgi:transcriptional regulator with GAF, ATPase, and Fis domain